MYLLISEPHVWSNYHLNRSISYPALSVAEVILLLPCKPLPSPKSFFDFFDRFLREVLDWRLAQYLARGGGSRADVICRVARNKSEQPILFLPSTSGPRPLEEGQLEISINDRPMVATVAKIAINVVRSASDDMNRLPEILRGWFGDGAGLPGRGDRVRIRLRAGGWTMEPMGAVGQAGEGLTLWERYSREAIPAAFGLTFDQATWNADFVPKPPHLFLLVTLEKDGIIGEHQYADHFISEVEFS
jgi:hypothetical protein